MIIKIIIAGTALGVLFFALNGRKTHVGRAWKKLGLLFLVIAMLVAVIFPDSTNKVAHFMGVGRGADLLLYLLTLAFITYAINNYLHQQDEKDSLYRLARKFALLEAEMREKDDSK